MKSMLNISNTTRCQFLLFVLILISLGCTHKELSESEFKISRDEFPNVLDIHNIPEQAIDWDAFCFADQGAWFGFALPDTSNSNYQASFVGPFLMSNGKWLGKSIVNLGFYNSDQTKLHVQNIKSVYYPGKLVQELSYNDFKAIMTLIFISSETALINVEFVEINNNIAVTPEWSGSIFAGEGKIKSNKENISISGTNHNSEIALTFSDFKAISNLQVSDTAYSFSVPSVNVSQSNTLTMLVTYTDENSHKLNAEINDNPLNNPSSYLDLNKKRWDNYINKALLTNAPWANKKEYQVIAVKSVETLINNWRCAYGDLFHDGLFPSYAVNYFNGFWAWDSWKHSVALVKFEPELAKNQIRSMYDYQNATGMIADCIYADSSENNWLNTKPPLSGWAIWENFKETNDTSFISEMYPKLVKYHEWWYKYRDINKNKLCEYGSSDGSLVAAKWESGMDNAIRFDKSAIIKIDESNYAFNQESVDLNSYLYFEKLFIIKMANLLGDSKTADIYYTESKTLKNLIETKMFDQKTGYYYDINTKTGDIINVQGPEGWTALFTGLSSATDAEKVIKIMLDTSKFGTYIPFPTAAKDDPEFSEGYWRGPVYFAINALNNYGYKVEVDTYTLQVFNRLEGLKEQSPIKENYWPLTGEGMRVNHFSWSAAHLLLLYTQNQTTMD